MIRERLLFIVGQKAQKPEVKDGGLVRNLLLLLETIENGPISFATLFFGTGQVGKKKIGEPNLKKHKRLRIILSLHLPPDQLVAIATDRAFEGSAG